MVTFANQSDFISFRHHMYDQPRGVKSVTLKEARARPPQTVLALSFCMPFCMPTRRMLCAHLAHAVRARATPPLQIGPRFEMRLYQIKLGTMEQQEAEVEWALRPYMRSGKKRKL